MSEEKLIEYLLILHKTEFNRLCKRHYTFNITVVCLLTSNTTTTSYSYYNFPLYHLLRCQGSADSINHVQENGQKRTTSPDL